MKKTLLTIICAAAVCAAAPAQSLRGQLGVRAGLNISTQSYEFEGIGITPSAKAGYHLGVSYDMPLTRSLPLYLGTGLNFTTLGSSIKEGGTKYRTRLSYLQIPAVVSYRIGIGDFSLQPHAGLYYEVAVEGACKYKEGGVKMKEDLFGENSDYDRSDFGLRIGLGATYREHYYFGFGYDFGFLNISDSDGFVKCHNGNFFISVGYNF